MPLTDWIYSLASRLFGSSLHLQASCYAYDDKLLFAALCRNEAGFYYRMEPYRLILCSESDLIVGQAILEILQASNRVVPLLTKEDNREFGKEFLRVSGVSSERKVQQKSISCHIFQKGNLLSFQPLHNGGTSGDNKGFSELDSDIELHLSNDTPTEKIGETLRKTLKQCTTVYK